LLFVLGTVALDVAELFLLHESDKKLYEPKRDILIQELVTLVNKFQAWKDEESGPSCVASHGREARPGGALGLAVRAGHGCARCCLRAEARHPNPRTSHSGQQVPSMERRRAPPQAGKGISSRCRGAVHVLSGTGSFARVLSGWGIRCCLGAWAWKDEERRRKLEKEKAHPVPGTEAAPNAPSRQHSRSELLGEADAQPRRRRRLGLDLGLRLRLACFVYQFPVPGPQAPLKRARQHLLLGSLSRNPSPIPTLPSPAPMKADAQPRRRRRLGLDLGLRLRLACFVYQFPVPGSCPRPNAPSRQHSRKRSRPAEDVDSSPAPGTDIRSTPDVLAALAERASW
jgi:hypothetical protein